MVETQHFHEKVDSSGKCGDFPVFCRNAGKHLEVQIICSYSKPILQARFGGNLGLSLKMRFSPKNAYFHLKCTFHQKVQIFTKMLIFGENHTFHISTYQKSTNIATIV